MRTRLTVYSAVLLVGCAMIGTLRAADEVRVMTSGGYAAPHLALVAPFERATANRVVTVTTSTGIGTDAIPNRIRRGEPVDVVILSDSAIDDLIKEGLIVAGSKAPLARSGIGMAVRAGAPRPDIRTVEGFKRALLDARSIAISAQVSGVYLSTELFPRLGIADQLKAKTQRIERERVGAVIARGEAEIGFQQISELLPIKGIEYVGPLPAEVQRITLFSAGVAKAATSPDAARALIRFYTSSEGVQTAVATGLERLSPR